MIIDCHGHFTTAPSEHDEWRSRQIEAFEAGVAAPPYPRISDDQLRESVEATQVQRMSERGIDITLLSPRASRMAHHLGDFGVSEAWTKACNDLIYRLTVLYPERFVGVAQLPQSPGCDIKSSIAELERCVVELGFVGVNLNPDPSGGRMPAQPLTDSSWYPLYEAMSELRVPAMVHVSTSTVEGVHTTGAHYLNVDTTSFMQLVEGDLFADFPDLKMIIPHGGGSVPYHWGRFAGLADMLGRPRLEDHVMKNVFFDTCVYHQPGISLLFDVVNSSNILFGSETFGAVRGVDPRTGSYYDDTRRYVDSLELATGERRQIFEGNALKVYERLAEHLGDV